MGLSPNQNQSRLLAGSSSLLFFFFIYFQGAQQNPRVKFLPDGPRGPPASLSGRLLLSFQYDQLLQQLEQDCQISQRSLRPRNLPPQQSFTVSDKILSYLSNHNCTIHVFRSNPISDFNCQTLSNLTVKFKEGYPSIHHPSIFNCFTLLGWREDRCLFKLGRDSSCPGRTFVFAV